MMETPNGTQEPQPTHNERTMSMDVTKNIGMLLLSIWLIVSGLVALVPAVYFNGLGAILGILAIAAGIFILIKK
ncbi:MAG: hypothetical protein NTZ35_17930 [Ignavibacteriales bacterium]|nr:hypothetical protein [Ignavibacteriales bacterium]